MSNAEVTLALEEPSDALESKREHDGEEGQGEHGERVGAEGPAAVAHETVPQRTVVVVVVVHVVVVVVHVVVVVVVHVVVVVVVHVVGRGW